MIFIGVLLASAFFLALRLVSRWHPGSKASGSDSGKIPVSVNYHFTRQCNKSCGFCFHTATTSHRLSITEAFRGLSMLKTAGMKKINFAGGEPFLHKKFLGEMITYCKDILQLESVSIVTNGSLVDRPFMVKYGQYIDILAVSCDSFHESTNIEIGRGSGDQIDRLFTISRLCKDFGIKFKLNTVVCNLNWQEDMNEQILRLQPFRWKCFQVLMVAGENDSEKTLRDVRKFQITDGQFETFCDKHKQNSCFVAESDRLMAKSYLLLDEYMRFLNRDGQQPSESILDVGAKKALEQVFWDEQGFAERGGVFDWTRDDAKNSCGTNHGKELEW